MPTATAIAAAAAEVCEARGEVGAEMHHSTVDRGDAVETGLGGAELIEQGRV